MGAEIQVPTMEGEHTWKFLRARSPELHSGFATKVSLWSMGAARATCREIRVQVPAKLNKRQRELLQELEAMAQVENLPQRRTLLGKMKDIFS